MFRVLSYLYIILCLSINISVAQKEVSVNELSELNGKVYYSTIPFTGNASEYYDNGNKKELRAYKEGLLNGQLLFYYPNSLLKEKINYKNNKKEGKHYSYYENGNKESLGHHKAGKREGKWKWWHENGQLRMESNFKANKYYGVCNVYTDDGTFLGGAQIIEGSGSWEMWYENGSRKEVGQFENGYLDILLPKWTNSKRRPF